MYRTHIYYQDTDAGGVVYFANYLRFFEKSWSNYLSSLGIALPNWAREDTLLIVKRSVLELIKKVGYGEEIEVRTSLTALGKASLVFSHVILRGDEVTTKGETEMVCIDGRGRPKRFPREFVERLANAKKA